MPSKLILLRHGESMGNVWPEAYINDATNFLTLRGVKQAELAGLDLKRLDMTFQHVITSNLTRARQTAVIVMQTMNDWQRHYEGDGRLNEWNKPEHEHVELLSRPETANQHYLRVNAAVAETILPALERGNVLCVTHWYTMQVIFKVLIGKTGSFNYDSDPTRVPNAVPYVYDLERPTVIDVLHSFKPETQY